MRSYRRRSASFCGPTASAARGSRNFGEEGGVRRAIPHSIKGIVRLVTIFLIQSIQSLLQHFQGPRRGPVAARELADQPFIIPQFADEEGFGFALTALGKAGGFTPRLEYRVQDFISAASLASAGYGVAIVPESMQNFSQPGVFYKPVRDFRLAVHLALAYRQREMSPAVRAFVKQTVDASMAAKR
ncbi:protein of unknown function (plasmid) [Cupriavidus taiwanensis]|uniref:LysR substrate-binding domain-containing protein n=1 Tax=Cupriavidus taiwanensis TaxID=164546 RepID=A0A9Q7UVU8_9BURK|nr:LysR family substrate-binding domain-containing protein [Cupriavidus taiwanensis]SPD66869.1 protein of unknown function [Cupriavidus taiwanensis]